MNALDHNTVLKLLPDREVTAHKGDFGKVLLLCGSEGYTGAAALAAMGALRVGAGLVYLGVPRSIYAIEAIKLTEPVIFPLPDRNGMLSCDSLERIRQLLPGMDAVLMGSGMGQSEEVSQVIRFVLENYSGPVVLDADGINGMSGHKDILRGRTGITILTPHEGEFSRFTGITISDRVEDARKLARELKVIVVLKGHETVITDGTSDYINPTGNPGMAVGGSGDVLAGMITGLLGQGITPLMSAACSVWLHGASGDICAKEIGQYGMLPSDMLKVLPRLLK